MRIGIDIDGVIADFVGTFAPMFKKIGGCDFDQIVNYNFKNNTRGIDQGYAKLWGEQVESGKIYEQLKPVEGSKEFFCELFQKHEIILISSREEQFREVTENWLKRKGIAYNELELVGHDLRGKIDKMCTCDVVFEDQLEVARIVAARGITVVLLDYPWNSISDNVIRVKDWKEVREKLGGDGGLM